jgi:two-component system, OmpR family, phosphate regulon sensor histidine kinase PhoR
VAALSTAAAGTFFYRAIGRHITDQAALGLREKARLVQDVLRREEDVPRSADSIADRIGKELSVRVTIVAEDGKVLGDTDLDGEALANIENHGHRPEILEAMQRGAGRATRYSTTLGENLLYVALRIDPDRPDRGVVRLALPLTAVRKARRELLLPLLISACLTIVASILAGWVAARGPAGKLEEMSRAASKIAEGRTSSRVRPGGQNEVGQLARSLNRMAEELERRLSAISRERGQLQSVLDGMVEGVLLTDGAGNILLANRAFQEIFDARPPFAGRRPLEVARIPALQEILEEARAAGVPFTREIALGAGVEKSIRASLAPLREESGFAGTVAVFHDVTELKRLENIRREFVANVSHELRTPLTAIRGYAETLRDGALKDAGKAAEFVRVIHRHAERLQALIEDLLDLSRVEQGKARLSLGPVSLREVMGQVEPVLRPLALEKDQSLELLLPDGLLFSRADRDRLAQVLINLLDNAVKFTPEGGRISLAAESREGRIVLTVRDSGIGIPPDEIGRIFERFYRVDRSRDRREGGTGLGLAIAKHLTLAMDGTIEVSSSPGEGTTFRLTFPAS